MHITNVILIGIISLQYLGIITLYYFTESKNGDMFEERTSPPVDAQPKMETVPGKQRCLVTITYDYEEGTCAGF